MDTLYLDRTRLMKLGCNALPNNPDDITDLHKLLRLVNNIIRPPASSPSQYKRELEKLQIMSTTPRQLSMHDWASEISRQLAFQDENMESQEKTWKLLEKESFQVVPLKTMAILSLVVFATMYGKVQLGYNSNSQLAKSIALLKQQTTATNPVRHWSETLKTVLNHALDVAAQVMKLDEPHDHRANANPNDLKTLKRILASAVHKIVNVVIVCWSQFVEVKIKRTGETLYGKSALLESNVLTLEHKLNEMILLSQDRVDTKHPPSRDSDEGATREDTRGPKESPNCHCWRKLRQMLNPNNIAKSLPNGKNGIN